MSAGTGASGAGGVAAGDIDDGLEAIAEAVLDAEEPPAPPDNGALARELLSDLGNARRMIARHGADMAYVEEWGWGVYDGSRWEFDGGDALARIRANETAEMIFEEAEALPRFEEDEPERPRELGPVATIEARAEAAAVEKNWKAWDKKRKRHFGTVAELKEFAVASTNAGKATAMLASAEPYLRRKSEDFDADPWLLNVENGTLHLGPRIALYSPRRKDSVTKKAAVKYDPMVDCPKWRAFIADIFPGAAEVAVFVQRWLGYCLTGSISEQRFVLFLGDGSNGKSTLLNVFAEILNNYAQTAPIETFLHADRKNASAPTPEIARMVGARLIRSSEPEAGARLSESVLKQWTGGERMTGRPLFKPMIEFKPSGKLTLSANIKPVIVGKDHGTKRRLLVVPFTRVLTREEKAARIAAIPRDILAVGISEPIEADLLTEAPGILNWLLDGFRLWREDGLPVPAAVVAATDAFFAEMDPIGQFVAEACITAREGKELYPGGPIVGPEDRERAGELFSAYKKWCDAESEEPKNVTSFGRRLNDLGIRAKKIGGAGYRMGIRLRADWQPSTPKFPSDD